MSVIFYRCPIDPWHFTGNILKIGTFCDGVHDCLGQVVLLDGTKTDECNESCLKIRNQTEECQKVEVVIDPSPNLEIISLNCTVEVSIINLILT